MECFMREAADPCPSALVGATSQLFISLIGTLTTAKCSLGPKGKFPSDFGPFLAGGEEFDFIVVRAGSAGSRIASRLAEENQWNVLLLEAGRYPSSLTEVPALFFNIEENETWQYVMQPCKTCCLGLQGNTCTCPRGKTLGGSSSINGMIYIRGNRRDFNTWAEAGNTGWDYDSVSKYFEKFERVSDQDGDHFGKDGDLEITRPRFNQPISQIIIDGYRQLGYGEYKEGERLGYLKGYTTIYQGVRNSAARAFLGKAKQRKNLKVATKAHVTKILIDRQTKAAYGVEVIINDKLVKLKATKEVILSAGAINSPKILINSGIGPKSHLKDLGVEMVQDLNVGDNLQDHPGLILYITIDSSVLKSKPDELDEMSQYIRYRAGSLNSIGLVSMYGFVNTRRDSVFPNMQYHQFIFYPKDNLTLPSFFSGFNQPKEIRDVVMELNKNNVILMMIPTLLDEKSVGKVRLRSADPLDPPLIYPEYFSDKNDADIDEMLNGVRFIEELINTDNFKKHNAKFINFNHPNCQEFSFQTDDFWKCSIRNFGTHIFHQVGTCKMGPARDKTAVVNPRLQVYHIKNLRVADASIMPKITSANTNSPTIMIGERAATFIKEDWS